MEADDGTVLVGTREGHGGQGLDRRRRLNPFPSGVVESGPIQEEYDMIGKIG